MAKRRTLLMRLLSWAANFTPNTFYYSRALEARVRDRLEQMEMGRSGERDILRPAALSIAIAAAHKLPKIGDTCISTIHGATHGGRDVGSFRVHIQRISDDDDEGA